MRDYSSISESENLEIDGKKFLALKINLQGAPFLIIVNGKNSSYLACGFFNMQASEKFGHIAGIVCGVKTFEEMLGADVSEMTGKAREICGHEKISGREFLEKVSENYE